MSALELLLALVPHLAGGVAAGLVMWGGVRADLRHLARETIRAHKRLDLHGAPNVTLEN